MLQSLGLQRGFKTEQQQSREKNVRSLLQKKEGKGLGTAGSACPEPGPPPNPPNPRSGRRRIAMGAKDLFT
ncbi:hypothetical protein CapIbe_013220 [Capra ibex]